MKPPRTLLAAAFVLFFAALPAWAVITRLYPLADVIADADTIAAVRVVSVDSRTRRVTLTRTADLKGKTAWNRTVWGLNGGDERAQRPVIQARLARGRTVVLFVKKARFALGYVEGTWFRLAPPKEEQKGPWQFVHLEIYLRRTFHGPSADLQHIVTDHLAGRKAAPPPDPDAKPGYGN